jgi:hypothetical protein
MDDYFYSVDALTYRRAGVLCPTHGKSHSIFLFIPQPCLVKTRLLKIHKFDRFLSIKTPFFDAYCFRVAHTDTAIITTRTITPPTTPRAMYSFFFLPEGDLQFAGIGINVDGPGLANRMLARTGMEYTAYLVVSARAVGITVTADPAVVNTFFVVSNPRVEPG